MVNNIEVLRYFAQVSEYIQKCGNKLPHKVLQSAFTYILTYISEKGLRLNQVSEVVVCRTNTKSLRLQRAEGELWVHHHKIIFTFPTNNNMKM